VSVTTAAESIAHRSVAVEDDEEEEDDDEEEEEVEEARC
jgi:hypothetical protein